MSTLPPAEISECSRVVESILADGVIVMSKSLVVSSKIGAETVISRSQVFGATIPPLVVLRDADIRCAEEFQYGTTRGYFWTAHFAGPGILLTLYSPTRAILRQEHATHWRNARVWANCNNVPHGVLLDLFEGGLRVAQARLPEIP